MSAYGVTKEELLRQTRALYEEAHRNDSYHVEDVTRAALGTAVFVWSNITAKQITALRRGILLTVLEGRGQ